MDVEAAGPCRRSLYKLGGATALLAVVVSLAEFAINSVPGAAGASQRTGTVIDWFALFQNHWFLGLRNLGLLNIAGAALLVPSVFAVYSVLRRHPEVYGEVLQTGARRRVSPRVKPDRSDGLQPQG
jgi:hypothetical protein